MNVDRQACARFLLAQERARGTGGVLLIRGAEWSYVLAHECQPESFHSKVNEVLDEFGAAHYVVMCEAEGRMDVFMIAKADAACMACAPALSPGPAPR